VADQVAISQDFIEFANSPAVKLVSKFEATASSIDVDRLHARYGALRDTAPHRHARDKKYFVGHSGVPSTTGASNRLEEHFAIALCNDHADLSLDDSDGLRLLDYQVPLKARQSDAGIGKVDIVALTGSGRVAVVELKVTSNTSKGDNPLRALLEALAYCAIVEANADDLASEIEERYGLDAATGKPDLVVVGPDAYWSTWTGPARTAVHELADRISHAFDMRALFVSLGPVAAVVGTDGARPRLDGEVNASIVHESGCSDSRRLGSP
jgi:hypothetical protein